MDINYIKNTTLDVFKECDIQSFPVNCLDILEHYQLGIFSYSSLDDDFRDYCLKYSEDAYCYKDKIFYNTNMPNGRIKFSLMHELGHILLNHCDEHTHEMEKEANYFASHLLAPRMAIHYASCKNEINVSNKFSITHEAALHAFDDYRRWHRLISYYKMNDFDKSMYSHFYNEQRKKFVYNITTCYRCGETLYNYGQCVSCLIYDMKHYKPSVDPAFRYR